MKVALVLASGGSRGLAHIGVIEELERRGYEITSVSGTSMGALIGGIYAAGGLPAFKEWMKEVDKMKVFFLMDFTISNDGIVKGEKIIKELEKIVPDVNIENLSIPFTAVATDIKGKKEVVFDKGSLFEAIRASISIPSLFKPLKIDNMVLIDGGVVNPIPINRVKRNEGDILVAVDLNAPYMEKKKVIKSKKQIEEEKNFFEKLRIPVPHFYYDVLLGNQKKGSSKSNSGSKESLNYYNILVESSSLMIQKNSERTIQLYKPDILISIPKNAYSTMEFYKYDEIVETGKQAAIKAFDSVFERTAT